MKKQQRPNTSRQVKTKKELEPTCRKFKTCERQEKYQGRCNSRCCPGYKIKK